MKNSGSTTIIIVIAIAMIMFSAAIDAFQKLKITEQDAQRFVLNSIESGYLNFPSTARTIDPTLRLTVAKEIAEFTKSFCSSAMFKSQYREWWMTQRPEKPASIEERLKDYETKNAQSKSDADQGLIELKKQRDAATDPETKKALTDALKQYEETQKQMQEQMQTPEMKNMMAQMDSLQREQFKVDFQVENEKYNADSVA